MRHTDGHNVFGAKGDAFSKFRGFRLLGYERLGFHEGRLVRLSLAIGGFSLAAAVRRSLSAYNGNEAADALAKEGHDPRTPITSFARVSDVARLIIARHVRSLQPERGWHRGTLRVCFRGLASTDVRERSSSVYASDAAAPLNASSGFRAAETQRVGSVQRTRPSTTSCCSAPDTMTIAVVCSVPTADWDCHTCAWTNFCSPARNTQNFSSGATLCWIFSAPPICLHAFEARI
ncbi:hypothetical protein HPB52_025420 [Rhipicephalus sanguineus]|uniref:Uncharacterized protein n=1 Tax=Rhipicephalus sanguineus TaxID=34632 RepID=A0A9D4TCX8_RHISA|nr:hypothetical protein HPB52_025420 [Rhipicephalus sanguineus]